MWKVVMAAWGQVSRKALADACSPPHTSAFRPSSQGSPEGE